ncbi:MAG: PUA domain-containing protein, partial [Caulobacteraceae bacterium]
RGERASLFLASTTPALAYKSWIAGSLAPAGAFVVDEGAAAAVRRGKSLLAAGVLAAKGRFGKGEAVVIETADGAEIGRGLSRYDAIDAARIVGLRSAAIGALLGYAAGPVIHADDLALTDGGARRA